MAAPSTLTEIVIAAAALKAAAPETFKTFCDTLRAYEVQAIADMLASTEPGDMFRAQGKVKTVQQLRKHITDCYELRDTYARRDTNARSSA